MITIEHVREWVRKYPKGTPVGSMREVCDLALSQHEEIEKLRNIIDNFLSLVQMHAFTIPGANPHTSRLVEAVDIARKAVRDLKSKAPTNETGNARPGGE